MTANAFDEDRDSCLAAGMNGHVTKPVDPAVLLTTLARWLPTANAEGLMPAAMSAKASLIEQDLALTLSRIPGLNSKFGLASVRGRMSSYRRLLNKFSHDHMDDFSLLRQHMAAGDINEARRLAHSLKGVAGTLGAVAVQKSAASLEAAIKEEQAATVISPLIEQTATAFAELCRHLPLPLIPDDASSLPLATGLSANQSANQSTNQTLSPEILAQLRHLLEIGEVGAQELVREQANALRGMLGHDFVAFEYLIATFDFEAALTRLNLITSPDV